MSELNSIHLSLESNVYVILIGIIILIAFSFYAYRFTIPSITSFYKSLLIILRAITLFLIFFIIFQPTLLMEYKTLTKPLNLLFIDNSHSVVFKDSLQRRNEIISLIENFNRILKDQNKIYTFGSRIDSLLNNDTENIHFNEPLTNFIKITNFIKEKSLNTASLVVVSDGIITDGTTPVYEAEKLGIPIYTIGIGDTLPQKDVEVKKVLFNEYIYLGKQTQIAASIFNRDYANIPVKISLLEGSQILDIKDIRLAKSGMNEIEINYTPLSIGSHKLRVEVTGLPEEVTTSNNSKTFFVDVLKSKLKILLIAGAPSPDVTFIINSIKSDENLTLTSIIELSENKFIGFDDFEKKLTDADILFIVGFPGKTSSESIFRKVTDEIAVRKIPYFISLGSNIDFNRLRQMEGHLPFYIRDISEVFVQAQPAVTDFGSSLLKSGSVQTINEWNKLPPIYISETDFLPKAGSEIISNIQIKNTVITKPLIITNKIGTNRSIALLARDIWRWKLHMTGDNSNLFDSFISNCIKWLFTSNDQKQFKLQTTKKIYTAGETVEFIAQVYDDIFNPVDNAEINMKLTNLNNSYTVKFNRIGNGLYSGTFETSVKGDYRFEGKAILNYKEIGSDVGLFNIVDAEIEKTNLQMDKDLLFLLAGLNEGKYSSINNYSELLSVIQNNLVSHIQETFTTKNLNLWSSEFSLILLILLFSLEWYLRKRLGLI